MTAPAICPRCCAKLHPLADLVLDVADAGKLALRASCDLEARRLAQPDIALFGSRDLARDLPRRLHCATGICASGEAPTAHWQSSIRSTPS